MNVKEQQNRRRSVRNKMPNRLVNPNLILTVTTTILAALVIVIGAHAVQTARIAGSGTVLKVPRDYTDIQAAIDAALPGDIIQVSEGIYAGNLILDKPVSLIAENFDEIDPVNNHTILDGGGGAATITIPPGLTQLPIIRGFEIRNGIAGIQASSPFIAEYNFFNSSRNQVSYDMGAGGANRNNVYFNAGDNAIRLDNMDRPLVIENNRIMYNGQAGIEASLQNLSAPPAPVEIDIWNNMILGNGEDGVQLIDHEGDPQDTNRRFVITGNLIANNQKAGIGLMPNADTIEDYSGADVVEAVRVFNNTFYGNDYGISGGDNLVAFNNIIANSRTRGVWRVQGAAGANSVVAYSLFHNNKVDAEETTLGAGVITGVDPLFEAVPNPGPDGSWATVDDDFSGLVLSPDSPAIDKGVTQFIANDGELVPLLAITGFTGAAPDLGWREFGAPIFITPTSTPISSSTPLPTATVATPTLQPSLTTASGSPTPLPPTATLPSLTPQTPTATPTSLTPVPQTATPVSPTSLVTAISASASPTPTASLSATNTTSPSTQVTIQDISPTSAQAATTVTMTINGSGFQNGAVVSLEGGQGAPQEILAVQVVDPTTIVVTMNVHNDGTSGAQVWNVRVTNPDGSTATLMGAFTVTPAL